MAANRRFDCRLRRAADLSKLAAAAGKGAGRKGQLFARMMTYNSVAGDVRPLEIEHRR
jgi:hypothetical protein